MPGDLQRIGEVHLHVLDAAVAVGREATGETLEHVVRRHLQVERHDDVEGLTVGEGNLHPAGSFGRRTHRCEKAFPHTHIRQAIQVDGAALTIAVGKLGIPVAINHGERTFQFIEIEVPAISTFPLCQPFGIYNHQRVYAAARAVLSNAEQSARALLAEVDGKIEDGEETIATKALFRSPVASILACSNASEIATVCAVYVTCTTARLCSILARR
ncbi:MAG: hypothetical protein HC802_23390 [Caldilineaceae bacterium]|nr:hypothetical protein [Caldilineaceae bacterium]